MRLNPFLTLLCSLSLASMGGCDAPSPGTVADLIEPPLPPPPAYPLVLPPSIYSRLPERQKPMVEEALREQKRKRLYRTKALLPALEIVRHREEEFKAAAKAAGLDLRLFQGLIVLECGGIEDAIDYMFLRGQGRRAHVGLGQIGSFEGSAAGLKVYPAYEERLKREIRHSIQLIRRRYFEPELSNPKRLEPAILNSFRRQEQIIREWKQVDERFDSRKNLRASARLLRDRMRTYRGDPTLTIASYHAGGGNIGKALRLYRKSKGGASSPTYWHLYEDRSGPVYRLMSGWSDNSRNYFPTVVAAADVVEKYLNAPRQFREEYLYWGPDDAPERLASVPYIAGPAEGELSSHSPE